MSRFLSVGFFSFFLILNLAHAQQEICGFLLDAREGLSIPIRDAAANLQESLEETGAEVSLFRHRSFPTYIIRIKTDSDQLGALSVKVSELVETEKEGIPVTILAPGTREKTTHICLDQVCLFGVTVVAAGAYPIFHALAVPDSAADFLHVTAQLAALGSVTATLVYGVNFLLRPFQWALRLPQKKKRDETHRRFSARKVVQRLKRQVRQIQNWRYQAEIPREAPSVIFVLDTGGWAIPGPGSLAVEGQTLQDYLQDFQSFQYIET